MAMPTLHAATGTLTCGLNTTLTINHAAAMVSRMPAHANHDNDDDTEHVLIKLLM